MQLVVFEEENGDEPMDFEPQSETEECRVSTPSRVEDECEVSDQILPCVGMTFDSDHEAYEFYQSYAMRMGFGVSKLSSRYSRRDKTLIAINFVCVRYGHHNSRSKEMLVAPRPSLKSGCQARVKLKINNLRKWVIVSAFNEHNHKLDPENVCSFRPFRKSTTPMKSQMKVLDTSKEQPAKTHSVLGKPSGGVRNTQCTQKDHRNFIGKYRHELLSAGDAQALYEYLSRKQSENPSFFYAIEVDDDQRLRNVFWVDGRSRVDYQCFGDVVYFDSTYLTSRYEMPFVPFVGVNHHQQSILFGCALIREETTSSFVWLFTTWLQAMGGKSPPAIITDHDKAITAAVVQVFPASYHRFCLWHIMKKVPEKLGHKYRSDADFMKTFHGSIYDSRTVNEFEERWLKMIEGYDLREDEWLRSLYEVRIHWVPTFLCHIFWAGMSSCQRNESVNHLFDAYVSPKTSLYELLEKYELAMEKRFEIETQADFDSEKRPKLISASPFEAQVASVYTREIFGKFSSEVLGCTGCHIISVEEKEGFMTFAVRDISNCSDYTVDWCSTKQNISCNCHLFNFKGYLCRHAMVSLLASGIYKIPSHFLLERWSKNAKTRHTIQNINALMGGDCSEIRSQRFNDLCIRALSFAEEGSLSKETYDVAVKALGEAFDKIILASGKHNLLRSWKPPESNLE